MANNLRILSTVIESVTVLIANKQSWEDPFERRKIERISMLLTGALHANGRAGLKMNVPFDHLNHIISLLPAMKGPTVSKLADDSWVAVETIIEEKVLRDIIPQLKSAGAQDIIEYPLNKIIP